MSFNALATWGRLHARGTLVQPPGPKRTKDDVLVVAGRQLDRLQGRAPGQKDARRRRRARRRQDGET